MQPERLMTPDSTSEIEAADAPPPPLCATLRGEVVVARLGHANTMFSRMRGLLGRSGLDRDEGLWIEPCPSIHMFFMRFPLDVVFLDEQHCVVRVHEDVRPWRIARGGKFAHSVLELPQGTAAFFNIRPGDRIVIASS
ncbi:MAG: hypothetical protein JWO69_960 [Thermoleophilia bacterium]|nr:hypothetical protein [Thermoleophilia bacterium]